MFFDIKIVAEWLYRKNIETNRTSIIFERTTHFVEFGASLRKECDVYKEQVPEETLVLSFFNKLKLKTNIFKIVYSNVRCTLVVPTDFWEHMDFEFMCLHEVIDLEKENLREFLTAIDTEIKDIVYLKRKNEIEFYMIHTGKDGNEYRLMLEKESEGTIKGIKFLFVQAKQLHQISQCLLMN